MPGLSVGDLVAFNFVRSALTTCPTTANQATVLLQGEDRVYISADINSRLSDSIDKLCDALWHAVLLPPSFHAHCTPLRFAAMDTAGTHIAVAGVSGETISLSLLLSLFFNPLPSVPSLMP